ncbi:hypothetical protein EW026_g5815 [Hermanssonia centrifuga]|uniref:Homeobox domain-containing protein n=1 Tax=Hermanssonia centrifuga TaxID=98765 RepID=A0A4V3X9Y0_9APHY|nr:hypothetical protein EW026_g5815 [Hermanssonia centrifuga]
MGPFNTWSQSPSTTPGPLPKQQQPRSSSSSQAAKDKPKKPRHRHSAFQLAALNELYDKDEHPPLEERTSLAERLGMEVKTVNAWFQNKRASSKKRSNKGASNAQYELPSISTLLASVPPPSSQLEYDELSEDEHPFADRLAPISSSHDHPRAQSLFYAGNPQHRHLFENESNSPRKGRSRPSAAQTEELRKLYDQNHHPSKEEREELGDRIGMRYQSVTNWFQNQRSIAKKRREEEEAQAASAKELERATSSRRAAQSYPSFPPSSSVAHPSLSVPPTKGHPSLPSLPFTHHSLRSPSIAPTADSRASSPRPSPYGTALNERSSSAHARSRRSRPEPYQLEALKKLFRRTSTPSIEERGALALEINMDVGKVTNWFRNLRQTSRRRSKRGSEFEDDDDDMSVSAYQDFSRNGSRAASPAQSSSSASSDRDARMDMDHGYPDHVSLRVKLETEEKHHRLYTHASNSRSSDMASEEDFQEAVTPSPASSPFPAFPRAVQKPAHAPQPRRDLSFTLGALSYAEMEKASSQFNTGVKVEDALLLLSFHHHVVR